MSVGAQMIASRKRQCLTTLVAFVFGIPAIQVVRTQSSGGTLPPGLVAAYGFDEPTGSTALDASGNNLSGTISGATRSSAGRFGGALSFDGVNDWVTVGAAAPLNLTTGMTLEAWVYPTAPGASWRNVLIKERSNGEAYNLYAHTGGSGPVVYVVRATALNMPLDAAATGQLPLDSWTHLAATYDNSTLRLYVNGVQAGSRAVSGALATSSNPLRIGGNSIWGEFFAGRIDEVRVYDRALTAAEIQADMTAPVSPPPAETDTVPPVRSNGLPTGTLPPGTTQASLSLITSEAATCRYSGTPGTAYEAMASIFATTGGTSHATPVSGLVNGGSYAYYVRCGDTAGNSNPTDFPIAFSIAASDTSPPQVSISSPSNGAAVAGLVTITADANDDFGVAGVQFIIDGSDFGSEDTTPPYSVTWNTAAAPPGPYTLAARARDGAGNAVQSVPINVAVANTPVPAGFRDEIVIGTDLTFPTSFEFLPDGRMLIAEFTGRVHVAQPGASAVDATPVLQLTNIFGEDVTLGGERGLVNVVADPDFPVNGHIYLFYTAASPQRDRVSRFTMTGNTASLATELVVWQSVANSTSTDHHGGGLAFGPDGKLYISTGDNGDPPSSQPLSGDHGKILRVNKDGTVPTDNPFFDGVGPNVDAIWARGLRNPYRFSIDSGTGRMYIGDVGFNTTEEVNIGIAGANYGWPVCEGSCATSGMTNPLFSYPHAGHDSAITGGFVYRGGTPAGLVARYTFDEGNGLSVADSSGNGLSGTISGAAWTSAGKYGGALSFDGINDWITVADNNLLDLTTGMTVEAWVFPTASGGWRNILIKESAGGEAYNLYASVDTNVPAAYVVRSAAPGVPLDARGSSPLPISSWTHLAATYDGAMLRLFVNGTEVGTAPVSGALLTSNGVLRIGGNSLWGEYFAGRIDDVRIYKRALSPAEINADMNATAPAGGGQFPSQYQGAYFYGDFAQNWIRYLTLDPSGTVTGNFNFLPADGTIDGPYDPVMLKPGPDGALYYVDFGWGWQSTVNPAAVRRIRYVEGDQPPTAVISAAPVSGFAPLSVGFSSVGSSDPEGQTLSYNWDFGDGSSSSEPHPTHVYVQPGAYSARLRLSDGTNSTVSEPLPISVGSPPVATITSPSNSATFRAGDVITFAGTAADAEDGPLPPSAFTWTVVFRHDSHVHPALGPVSGISSGSFTIPTAGHDFSGNTRYELLLTVTDSNGLQGTASVTIFPRKVNLTFSTIPTGLSVVIDGIGVITPHVKDSLVGFQHTINAPDQAQAGTGYIFVSWSDGGSQTHQIVVPDTARELTATFALAPPPPAPAGLVASYGFNEGTGSSVQDTAGNNLTGAINGASWTPAGKYGSALSFDGINDFVRVPDANVLDLTTGMTLEAWVWPTTLGSGWRNVIIKERSGGEAYNLYANVDTGVPAVYVVSAAAPNVPLDARGTATLPTNTWSHLAATFDGSALRLYVNGTFVGTRAVAGGLIATTGDLRIGGNGLWGEFFAGLIDEVRIYNRALSPAEIQAEMNLPIQP
jgi:glucose/arabinose dehydrogenase